ncbi:MAG: hypothetical protein LLG06_09285 [Desulfobacteraceae bacterium]|nr:hypothetical protein [Desulfobacteraceae bacterium]
MLEALKKSIYAGIGAAALTRDKIRAATKKYVDEGKLTADEAERLAEDLAKTGEREVEDINAKMQSYFKKFSESVEVVRKKEFLELKARVDALEEKLGGAGKGSEGSL